MFSWFKKKWEVYDSEGKVWEKYRRESNAWTFCREMNEWRQSFDNKTFGVRRIGAA